MNNFVCAGMYLRGLRMRKFLELIQVLNSDVTQISITGKKTALDKLNGMLYSTCQGKKPVIACIDICI